MSKTLEDLTTEIAAAETVIDGAIIYINGVPGLIADAVAKATANGATAEQLAPVAALGGELKAKADALQAAIVANTPAQ